MSTIQEIIRRADEIRPNAFLPETKMRWLSELDGKIAADVFLMGIEEIRLIRYVGEEGLQQEPLVSYPHEDIYELWLIAKIDAGNGEYNRYQNSMQLYNEAYSNFVCWFTRVYEPAQGGDAWNFVPRSDIPSYYLTAYGLALKQGFVGSLDEWLAYLVGPKGEQGAQGEQGARGEQGPQGLPGYSPVRGEDYWTPADVAEIKSYIDQKLLGDTSAALDSILAMQNELIGGDEA